jgi:hypothetical protein
MPKLKNKEIINDLKELPEDLKELQKIHFEMVKEIRAIKLRMLARSGLNNLLDLARFIGYEDVDDFHFELQEFIREEYKFNLILVPRGHLKTTLATYTHIVQKILKNPNISILIFSATWELAQDMLDAIKKIFESEKFIQQYGSWKGKVWNETEITVKFANPDMPDNTHTIETAGVDKGKTSKHYDLIIVDDIAIPQNMEFPKDRAKVKRIFQLLVPMMKKPNGQMYVIGTRQHEDDLYNHILENMKKIFKTFIRSAEIMDQHGNKYVLFPKKYTLEALEEDKISMGSYAYSCQMMNDPKATTEKYLQFDMLKWIEEIERLEIIEKLHSLAIPQDQLAIIVDPTGVEEGNVDYCAINCVKYDKKTIDILDMSRFKARTPDIVEAICDYILRYRIYTVYIEKGALEANIKYYLEQRLEELGLSQLVTIEALSHGGISKTQRILSIEPFIRRKQVRCIKHKYMRISKDAADESDIIQVDLKTEMDNFPNGSHDDMIDTIGYIPKVFDMDVNFFDFSIDKEKRGGYIKGKETEVNDRAERIAKARRPERDYGIIEYL